MLQALYIIAAIALLVPTLPLVLELGLLSLAAIPRPRRTPISSEATSSLAVIIPAHNEEKLITSCVTSLRTSTTQPAAIYVIAHNCSDATAANAAAAGATVLPLSDDGAHGKGAALFFGMNHALAHGASAVLVVDADSRVSPRLVEIADAALSRGAAAVQARYTALLGNTQRERLMALALYGFNVVRPRGRQRLGLSCGIFGNGFGVSAETLRAIPYTAHSLVEDLEYHIHLVHSDRRVHFLDDAEVQGEVPDNNSAAATQRARWEGGRALMRHQWTSRLLRRICTGHPRLIEPLFDLIALPTGTVVLLLLLGAIPPILFTRLYALAGLGSVALYVAVSIGVSDNPSALLTALATVPKYLLFKLGLLKATHAAASGQAQWVRTDRNE